MQLFVKSYITSNILPELAILIPEKLDTINASVFFTKAGKIEVVEEQFLAYFVYLENRKFLIIESGRGAYTLLSRMTELKNKNVNKFLFVNKGYSLNKKNAPGDILLLKKSVLSSSEKSISVNTELMQSLKENQSIKTGVNLSIDIDELFFNNKIKSGFSLSSYTGKKEITKFNTLSVGDFYFLKYIKQNKLSGAAMNYITGYMFQEDSGDGDEYFNKAMNLVVEYLYKIDK